MEMEGGGEGERCVDAAERDGSQLQPGSWAPDGAHRDYKAECDLARTG